MRKHRHFNGFVKDGWERKNAYVITESYVQFSFEKEVEIPLPSVSKSIANFNDHVLPFGLDTGIKKLATLVSNDGNQFFGTNIEEGVKRKVACVKSQNGRTRSQRALRHDIDTCAQDVVDYITTKAKKENKKPILFIEDLKNLKKNTKKDQKLNRSVRRTLGSWTYAYWLRRLEMTATASRARVVKVPPAYTSQSCSSCGHTERANRKLQDFECLECGFQDDADVNAARNILLLGLQDLGLEASKGAGAVKSFLSSSEDGEGGEPTLPPAARAAGDSTGDTVPVSQPLYVDGIP